MGIITNSSVIIQAQTTRSRGAIAPTTGRHRAPKTSTFPTTLHMDIAAASITLATLVLLIASAL